MTGVSAAQYLTFVALVTIATKPLRGYLYRVFTRQPTLPDRLCLPLERTILSPVRRGSGLRT